jgi:hypothetical protein
MAAPKLLKCGEAFGSKAARSPLVLKPLDGSRVTLVWLMGGLLNPWMLLCYAATSIAANELQFAIIAWGVLASTLAASLALVRGLFIKRWSRGKLLYIPFEAALAVNLLVVISLLLLSAQFAVVALIYSLYIFPIFALPAALAGSLIAGKLLFETSVPIAPQFSKP